MKPQAQAHVHISLYMSYGKQREGKDPFIETKFQTSKPFHARNHQSGHIHAVYIIHPSFSHKILENKQQEVFITQIYIATKPNHRYKDIHVHVFVPDYVIVC